MALILRSSKEDDLRGLMGLTAQFTLLNLPNNAELISEKIERSRQSFAKKIAAHESEYLFVVEDTDTGRVVGSSLIIGKHGTSKSAHVYFKVLKREKFSRDLGIGFVHQVLKFCEETNGPTEIGGLLVDFEYRRVPEKIGKQISLVRFLYMGMNLDRIEKRILCELSPPLTSEGRSEFWEALGRRFTGLNYQEADRLSQQNKEFIKSLFPQEEIYTSILSSSARLVLGRVADSTRAAQHMLEKLGFKYLEEIDPFDGGPHYGIETMNISLVKNTKEFTIQKKVRNDFSEQGFVGIERGGEFYACQTAYQIDEGQIILPQTTKSLLKLEDGNKVFNTTMSVDG